MDHHAVNLPSRRCSNLWRAFPWSDRPLERARVPTHRSPPTTQSACGPRDEMFGERRAPGPRRAPDEGNGASMLRARFAPRACRAWRRGSSVSLCQRRASSSRSGAVDQTCAVRCRSGSSSCRAPRRCLGLHLATRIGGERLAQIIQLAIEYDLAPPFDVGSPDKAPPDIRAFVQENVETLTIERMRARELLQLGRASV